MHLKGGLHVHTTCSDGELAPLEAIAAYSRQGFDFIALTDHDHLLRPGCINAARLAFGDMIIFTGVELTVFEKGYCHINRINGDAETLFVFNHPAQLDLPFDKVLERIRSVSERYPIDAVEVTNNGFRSPEFDVPEMPYPRIATDDAHNRQMIGRAWLEMDAPRDKDAILRAIRAGDFWNCYAG